MYYKSKLTNKILTDSVRYAVDSVYGTGTFEDLINESVVMPVEEPTVEECLVHGTNSAACLRYRELHPECASFAEARSAVMDIRNRIKKSGKKTDNDE